MFELSYSSILVAMVLPIGSVLGVTVMFGCVGVGGVET